MPIPAPTLLINLDPAAALTRAFSANGERPWTAGYNARVASNAAARVFGLNMPNFRAAPTRRIVVVGAGAAANAAPFTYTVPAGVIALPVTADVTPGSAYLNCICRIWAPGDEANPVWVERIATGGANVTRAMFRVQTATTFSIAISFGATYADLPAGYICEIIVADPTEITTLVNHTAANTTVATVKDFMCAGDTAIAGAAVLNRIFQ